MLVHTAKGLIERELLEVKDTVSEEGSARTVATEWYLNGELVRRDAWANIYAPQSISGEQVKMG